MTSTKKPTVRPVEVSIETVDDTLTCPMALVTWRRILAGRVVTRVVPYRYEGQRLTSKWTFNGTGPGTLHVGYDDCGVHSDGALSDAKVLVGAEQFEMSTFEPPPIP